MEHNMEPITSFSGDYRWLSNFWECSVEFEGVIYPSSEHAYQAAKTLDKKERLKIRDLDTAGKAKRAGKKLEIRGDWEDVKLGVMEKILVSKFERNPELRDLLIETGTAQLVETNTWSDVYWGVCRSEGKNHLGKILMRLRLRYQEESASTER